VEPEDEVTSKEDEERHRADNEEAVPPAHVAGHRAAFLTISKG
jgi:hypothetical protein